MLLCQSGGATHRLSIGVSVDGKLTGLTTAPGGHALAERPDEMTFESGGQGLWSTVDEYLTFTASSLVVEK
jgi:hypothetical protein